MNISELHNGRRIQSCKWHQNTFGWTRKAVKRAQPRSLLHRAWRHRTAEFGRSWSPFGNERSNKTYQHHQKQPKTSKNSINHSFCEVSNFEQWPHFSGRTVDCGLRTLSRLAVCGRPHPRSTLAEHVQRPGDAADLNNICNVYSIKSEQKHFQYTFVSFCSNQAHKFHTIFDIYIHYNLYKVESEPLLCSHYE